MITGGYSETGELDLRLAQQLVLKHISELEALVRSVKKGSSGLAYDPRQSGVDRLPHINIYPGCSGPGMYPLPIFVALAALVTGLQVGRQGAHMRGERPAQ